MALHGTTSIPTFPPILEDAKDVPHVNSTKRLARVVHTKYSSVRLGSVASKAFWIVYLWSEVVILCSLDICNVWTLHSNCNQSVWPTQCLTEY